ncbi:hypothetical protein Tco_0578417 [Tanacetum coccineum]
MSISNEALAMAGVDYNEWGMDIEEYERREMEPPPPHLWVDDYIEHENEGEDDVKDEEALMMATEEAIDEICGSRAVEIHLEDVYSERNKDGNVDDFGKRSPMAYNKVLNHDHVPDHFVRPNKESSTVPNVIVLYPLTSKFLGPLEILVEDSSSCPIFDENEKCGFYGFLDPELPSEYYKDLLYKMHVEKKKFKKMFRSPDSNEG